MYGLTHIFSPNHLTSDRASLFIPPPCPGPYREFDEISSSMRTPSKVGFLSGSPAIATWKSGFPKLPSPQLLQQTRVENSSFQDTYCRHVNIGNQYLALHGRLCESMIILITKPLTNSTITNVTLLYGTITNSVAHQFCFITWFRQGLPTCMPVN